MIAIQAITGSQFLIKIPNFGTHYGRIIQQPKQRRFRLLKAYYHWELTRERLERWGSLSQLFSLLTGKSRLGTNSASALLLSALTPKLGETRTEVTLTGAHELTLRREGAPGLTGLELITLANWFEMTNFPWCGFQLASRGHEPASQ